MIANGNYDDLWAPSQSNAFSMLWPPLLFRCSFSMAKTWRQGQAHFNNECGFCTLIRNIKYLRYLRPYFIFYSQQNLKARGNSGLCCQLTVSGSCRRKTSRGCMQTPASATSHEHARPLPPTAKVKACKTNNCTQRGGGWLRDRRRQKIHNPM